MLNKLAQFMMGRYGNDSLNFTLLIFALISSLLGQTLGFYPLLIISYALLGYSCFRTFSRNIPARRKELNNFMNIYTPFLKWFSFKKTVFKQRNEYTYFKCPKCKQQLRAPKGRGKISVTCQKCHNEFTKKV